jgi:hypothetical protein
MVETLNSVKDLQVYTERNESYIREELAGTKANKG